MGPWTMNRRLWSLVRSLPGGEETMRDIVVRIRYEDCQAPAGQAVDTSTRSLSDAQFALVLDHIEKSVGRPQRRRSTTGDAVYPIFDKKGDRRLKYINFMAQQLHWSREKKEGFIRRQTKGKGIKTHRLASAVIEPMERMMKQAGRVCDEKPDGSKWWSRGRDEQDRAL